MTTKSLLKWVKKAQDVHEKSWNGENYTISYSDAVARTSPAKSSETEFKMACFLINHAWNEVQEWEE